MILKSDVNVPHGKAATETLMLTTVVSPGRQMTPGRSCGEEEGVTMLRSDAELRPGRGAPVPVNVKIRLGAPHSGERCYNCVTTSSRAFKISCDQEIL